MAHRAVCLVTWVCQEEGTGWNLPVNASNIFSSTHLIPHLAGCGHPGGWGMRHAPLLLLHLSWLLLCPEHLALMRKHLPPEGQCVLMQVSSQPLLLRAKVWKDFRQIQATQRQTSGAGVKVLGID